MLECQMSCQGWLTGFGVGKLVRTKEPQTGFSPGMVDVAGHRHTDLSQRVPRRHFWLLEVSTLEVHIVCMVVSGRPWEFLNHVSGMARLRSNLLRNVFKVTM